MYLDPSDETVHALLQRRIVGPVVMLNLLRFREVADYSSHPELDPREPIAGRAANEKYVSHTLPLLEATGGSIMLVGEGGMFFVGPPHERWDVAMLVRQNTIEDFFSFASHPEYLAGLGHRTAALEDSRLLPLIETATS